MNLPAAFLFAPIFAANPRSPKEIRGAAQKLRWLLDAGVNPTKAGPLRSRIFCGGPNPRDSARVSRGCIGNLPVGSVA